MIAQFPDFSPLSEDIKEETEVLIKQFEPYSDFNFTSMFCWNTDQSAALSRLGNNLVIRIPDYIDGKNVYSLIGEHKIRESVDKLLEITPEIKLVPKIVIDNLKNRENLDISEDPDNFDYIYSVDEILNLSGKSNKKQRNKLNQFKNEYPEHKIINQISQEDIDKQRYIEIFDEWASHKELGATEKSMERKAISILIDNFSMLDLLATTVEISGRTVGFSINEDLGNGYAICHFQKYITSHKNIDTALTFFSSQQLLDRGCKYVNWEQDLGIKGIKRTKGEYKPSGFLEKYRIKNLPNQE